MNHRWLGLLLCTAAIAAADIKKATRYYDGHDAKYYAEFVYDTDGFMTPLTNPPGKPHYFARFDLYRLIPEANGKIMIAQNVPGEYIEGGCFEDSLESLMYAVNQQQGTQKANDAQFIGQAIHFAPVTVTNSVQTNVAYLQFKVRVPSETFPTNTGYLILHWILENKWIEDPAATNSVIDTERHFDTNIFSTNLMARVIYPGVSNVFILESIPFRTNIFPWRWNKTKVYE